MYACGNVMCKANIDINTPKAMPPTKKAPSKKRLMMIDWLEIDGMGMGHGEIPENTSLNPWHACMHALAKYHNLIGRALKD